MQQQKARAEKAEIRRLSQRTAGEKDASVLVRKFAIVAYSPDIVVARMLTRK